MSASTEHEVDRGAIVPSLDEFVAWDAERVASLVRDKTVIFSPGGSSRWYFLRYGKGEVSYDDAERFRDYSRRTLDRILEVVAKMLKDGVRTVLVVGMTEKQISRNAAYNQHLSWASELLVDEETQERYDKHEMGVLFRGGWQHIFSQIGAAHLLEKCAALEKRTAWERESWLIWVAEDDPLPQSLHSFLLENLRDGGVPDRASLCEAFYGRPLEHAEVFIGNNKPTLEGQLPPLLTVGDLYFTANLCLDMDHWQWRSILYDHLFARRGHYRDYAAMDSGILEELRAFYHTNQGITLGVGSHHAPSRTWRPILPRSVGKSPLVE